MARVAPAERRARSAARHTARPRPWPQKTGFELADPVLLVQPVNEARHGHAPVSWG
ncbi:hypothetical protein [Allokutzneria oryzae]|uniref:Uncharacterized protein n=1 Tax=Allokutzneria oryzae TaxID=1378989 RepID=A0ABV6A386_9PSEU